MAKITFVLREPEAKKETPIHLIVRMGKGWRLVFPTSERINPKFWESDRSRKNFQRAKETSKFPIYPEFNLRLDSLKNAVLDSIRTYQNNNDNKIPSVEELREILKIRIQGKTQSDTPKDLFGFIQKFLEELEYRINDHTGKLYSYTIKNTYRRGFELLKEYKLVKRKRVDFDTIDMSFYYDYVRFLTENHKFAKNTKGKHIKTLKTFLNEATERGINSKFIYKSKKFKGFSDSTDSIYLSVDELEVLENLDLSHSRKLDHVRDLFLVGCWTGLRFSDFTNIKPENIKGNNIEIQTQKTGEWVVTPILPPTKRIMSKYEGKYPNCLPPSISNAKMNLYLKEIGKLLGKVRNDNPHTLTIENKTKIDTKEKYESICTHTARRSFATNMYNSKYPIHSIMKITGHKSEKVFFSYIKTTKSESADLLHLHYEKTQRMKVA